jgi:phosphoribosyl-ATP pyrophosphohydrolase
MNKKKETDFLQELFNIIQNKAKGKDNKSYTKFLLKSVKNKIAKKVGE